MPDLPAVGGLRRYTALTLCAILLFAVAFAQAGNCLADLTVVREVVVAPKKGSLAANIGPVNRSANIRLAQAMVNIHAGAPPSAPNQPLMVSVNARFILVSESDKNLRLTVGFPVSDSEYSSFGFTSFEVRGPEGPRSVFQRTTAYPRRMTHRLISGPDGDPARLLPDVGQANKRGGVYRSRRDGRIMGGDSVGTSELGNLMVWAETFKPGETKAIILSYVMKVPLQDSRWSRRRVKGNYKGVWPQEANNLPLAFLRTLPKGNYYFFDYYLVTGAAWKGTIGREEVRLVLDRNWQGHRLHCNLMPELRRVDAESQPGATAYVYPLRNREPTENLYFALTEP
jgi:hypothetical protein